MAIVTFFRGFIVFEVVCGFGRNWDGGAGVRGRGLELRMCLDAAAGRGRVEEVRERCGGSAGGGFGGGRGL